jgi:hypothetical protein
MTSPADIPGTLEHLCDVLADRFDTEVANSVWRFALNAQLEYSELEMALSADDLIDGVSYSHLEYGDELAKFIIGYFGGSGTAIVPWKDEYKLSEGL